MYIIGIGLDLWELLINLEKTTEIEMELRYTE